jgi:hypothetical protein
MRCFQAKLIDQQPEYLLHPPFSFFDLTGLMTDKDCLCRRLRLHCRLCLSELGIAQIRCDKEVSLSALRAENYELPVLICRSFESISIVTLSAVFYTSLSLPVNVEEL